VEDEAGAVTAEGTWVLVVLSRSLNMLTGGSHCELFCSRAHRKGWAICWYIDAMFRFIRADDREHCRACFLGNKRSARLRQRARHRNGIVQAERRRPQSGLSVGYPRMTTSAWISDSPA